MAKKDAMRLFATWKNRLALSYSVDLARSINRYACENPLPFELSICPSMVALKLVAQEVSGSITITAQNMVWDDSVSFTGETSAESLVELGSKYVMLGHSERRLYLGEGDDQVARKVVTAVRHGLIPLVCVGEFLEDYQQGRAEEVIQVQMRTVMESLRQCENPREFLIAYEPAWAISTNLQAAPCDPVLAEQRHEYIRELLASHWNQEFARNVSIIYGAGVTKQNIGGFLSQPNVDGILAGGASQTFGKLIELIELMRQVPELGTG